MSGIRYQHPTQRNCRYTIVEPDVPYARPYQCSPPAYGGCGSVHLFKTHHLDLDQTGAAIVSTAIHRKIRHRLIADGFVQTNAVRKPPARMIGAVPIGGAGVLLHHPTVAGQVLIVTEHDLPYPTPYSCGICKVDHTAKTHHIPLDESGFGMVSSVLFDRIEPLLDRAGFDSHGTSPALRVESLVRPIVHSPN